MVVSHKLRNAVIDGYEPAYLYLSVRGKSESSEPWDQLRSNRMRWVLIYHMPLEALSRTLVAASLVPVLVSQPLAVFSAGWMRVLLSSPGMYPS